MYLFSVSVYPVYISEFVLTSLFVSPQCKCLSCMYIWVCSHLLICFLQWKCLFCWFIWVCSHLHYPVYKWVCSHLLICIPPVYIFILWTYLSLFSPPYLYLPSLHILLCKYLSLFSPPYLFLPSVSKCLSCGYIWVCSNHRICISPVKVFILWLFWVSHYHHHCNRLCCRYFWVFSHLLICISQV